MPIIRRTLDTLGIPIVGAAEHEADDVIGTLATRATVPVDIVTGDRDLFQLVDDARDVRVIYTARGMSNLEIVTDATVVTKYGVLPSQYADFATLRGDASDGLPGSGRRRREDRRRPCWPRTATSPGILAAAEAGEGMSAGVRAKLLAGLPYLAVAPDVVAVVRISTSPKPDTLLRPLDESAKRMPRPSQITGLWARR